MTLQNLSAVTIDCLCCHRTRECAVQLVSFMKGYKSLISMMQLYNSHAAIIICFFNFVTDVNLSVRKRGQGIEGYVSSIPLK